MSNIRIDLEATVIDGQALTFKSPVDCSQITGLIIYYPVGETKTSKVFQFADAHGNNVGSVSLFAANVLVKVILDTALNRAYVQNADTNKYIEETFLKRSGGTMTGPLAMGSQKITGLATPTADTDAATKKYADDLLANSDASNMLPKSGGTMTGMVQFKPANGTSVITSEVYRNLPASNPTASYKTRNVIATSGAAMQFFKGDVNAEPATEVNRLTLTENDTQLMKPLTVGSGGTDATTAAQARANLGAAPSGYGYGGTAVSLGTATNETELNTAIEAVYSKMAVNETKLVKWYGYPANDYNWFGILAKSSANYGTLDVHSASGKGSLLLKVKSGGTWENIAWVNPPMNPGTEYRTTEKYYGNPVYVKMIDFGNLVKDSMKTVSTGGIYAGNIIRLEGNVYNSTGGKTCLPAIASPTDYARVWASPSSGALVATCVGDYSKYTCIVWIWYVK